MVGFIDNRPFCHSFTDSFSHPFPPNLPEIINTKLLKLWCNFFFNFFWKKWWSKFAEGLLLRGLHINFSLSQKILFILVHKLQRQSVLLLKLLSPQDYFAPLLLSHGFLLAYIVNSFFPIGKNSRQTDFVEHCWFSMKPTICSK